MSSEGVAAGRRAREVATAEVVRGPSETWIALTGELDMSSVEDVRPVIDAECSRRPQKVTIDLSSIEFIDSHALRL